MGADFLYAAIWAKKGELGKELNAALDRLNMIQSIDDFDEAYREYYLDEDMITCKTDSTLTSDVEKAKDQLKAAIEECLNWRERRDSGWLEIGDYEILFSGGMSWGDVPTNLYEYINQVAESGLFHYPGEED